MPEFLLALDCGTTSAKALIARLDGTVVAATRLAITSHFPKPGLVEQDADQVWELCLQAMRAALAEAGITSADLAGVGITTQRASIVLFDAATGHALAPMIVWSDTRGLARAAELQAEGFMVWPQTPAAKLEAGLALIDGWQARAAVGQLRFGTLDTYLAYRLSGGSVHATDVSNAWVSGYSDFFQAGASWNTALLERQQIPAGIFPSILDSTGMFGMTSPLVLGSAVPIGAILADQQCALFAHNGLEAGGWKAALGTSGVIIAATGAMPSTPHHTMPPQALARMAGETRFCVEGMVITAGVLLEYLSRTLGLFDSPSALEQAAHTAQPSGVAIRPSLQGLGAPHGRFDARGVIAGLSPGAGKAEIARAALEGIAFRMAEIAAPMRAAGLGSDCLPVDGGLAASSLFCQLLADATGLEVRRHAVRDGAAYGAMVAAGLGTGVYALGDLAGLARYDQAFTPARDAQNAAERLAAWRAVLADAAV